MLLRILPGADGEEAGGDPDAGQEISRGEGEVTVRNPCLSGGAIEVFLEPVLPAPRVLVAGDSPIVAALRSLGPQVGLQIVAAQDIKDGVLTPSPATSRLSWRPTGTTRSPHCEQDSRRGSATSAS